MRIIVKGDRYSNAQIYVNCADDFIRTHAYGYTRIHARLMCLCYSGRKLSLCFIVVKKKEVPSLKKRRDDNGKLTFCTKLIGKSINAEDTEIYGFIY